MDPKASRMVPAPTPSTPSSWRRAALVDELISDVADGAVGAAELVTLEERATALLTALRGARSTASTPSAATNAPSAFELSIPFKIFIGSAYLVLNTVLNLLNKWALSRYGFKFPMVLTSAHMLFGSLALLPLMVLKDKYRTRHAAILRSDWKALLFVGCMNGPQIAANNASLVTIELSLNQVIRAAIPVCVALFALRRRPAAALRCSQGRRCVARRFASAPS